MTRSSTRATGASPKWHRFGVHFADGGSFMLRDPRRLGAVELDPDESRLGPDALTLTCEQLDHALGAAHRAGQGRADGPGAASPGSATCSSTRRCGGPGSTRAHAPSTSTPTSARTLHKAIRTHAARARPAGRIAHRRHAARSRRGVPARRRAAAAPNGRRAHDVLVSGSPALNPYDRRRDRAVGAQDRTPGAAAVARNRPRALRRAQRRPRSDALLPGAADARAERRHGRRDHGELLDRAAGDCGRSRWSTAPRSSASSG